MASDWEFIFDGVFGYLSSPLWTVPIMSFIDSESTVFEPSEENHLSWTDVHNRYKKLVESLLGCYLKDVGITEEQFMRACVSSTAQKIPSLQVIQEQLFAADNFEIFKRLMVQRNVELQLEALEMIQKRQGMNNKGPSKSKSKTAVLPSEEEILQAVLRQSELEYKQSQEKLLSEANSGKKVSSSSPSSKQNISSSPSLVYDKKLEAEIAKQETESERLVQDVLEKREETKKTVDEVLKNDINDDNPEMFEENKTQPAVEVSETNEDISKKERKTSTKNKESSKKEVTGEDNERAELPPLKITTPRKEDTPRKENTPDPKPASLHEKSKSPEHVPSASKPQNQTVQQNKDELSKVELEKRTEYLKQQRDRLLALKKQQREKQLDEYTKAQPERPKSARAAAQAVANEENVQQQQQPVTEDPQKLALRKALAAKLKKEVINR